MSEIPQADPYSAAPAAFEPPPGYVLTPAVREPRSKTLGLVAFLVALVVIVGTVVASTLIGHAAAPYAYHGATSLGYNLDIGSSRPGESSLAILNLLEFGLGTVLGIWALVQGIVATATRRGRGFGIAAIVLAALGPIVAFSVTLGSLAASLS
jgi:hypothetical protein